MTLNLEKAIEKLRNKELLLELEIMEICGLAREMLLEDPNVVRVISPVTIIGDIHGQFEDLLQIFQISGNIPDTNYLFLGDYVDRGFNSLGTFLLLLSYKLLYPERVTLLRGNHESRQITQVYGFYDECLAKYNSLNPWRYCVEVFDYLALAAIIDNQYFCMHGGLSPNINSTHDVRTIDRKQEIPCEGSMCDLLWSDPEGYGLNTRGLGCTFGADIVEKFNKLNKLEMIIRSHQLAMDGFKKQFQDKIVTVWSAPNYCFRCGNKASLMHVRDKEIIYRTFESKNEKTIQIETKAKIVPDYFL